MLSIFLKHIFFIASRVQKAEPVVAVQEAGGRSHLRSVFGISVFAMKPVIPILPVTRTVAIAVQTGKTG